MKSPTDTLIDAALAEFRANVEQIGKRDPAKEPPSLLALAAAVANRVRTDADAHADLKALASTLARFGD